MQTDTSQTDTLKHNSIAPTLPADTIKPDTESVKVQGDSLPGIEKKDSIPPSAKKNDIKPALPDSVKKTGDSPPPPPNEPILLSTGISSDSSLDSTLLVQPKAADTAFTIIEPAKAEEEHLPEQLRIVENNTWAAIVFLSCFALLVWTKVSYTKRINQFFGAFLGNRYIKQMVREEFVFSHPLSIALSVVFLLSSAILLTQANHYYHWNIFLNTFSPGEETGFGVFLKFLFSITAFYIAKILVIRLTAILFAAGEEITEYLFNLFLFNNVLGILLLPLAIAVVYANAISPQKILIFSGGLIFLAFLFRLVKSVYIGSITTKFSKSYIILYICTLEILPLIVVIKAFSGSA